MTGAFPLILPSAPCAAVAGGAEEVALGIEQLEAAEEGGHAHRWLDQCGVQVSPYLGEVQALGVLPNAVLADLQSGTGRGRGKRRAQPLHLTTQLCGECEGEE